MAGITFAYDHPFYTGSAGISALVPYPYDVAIAGRPYPVTFEFTPFRREAYRHISLEITRTQADTDGVPGEHTLNVYGLWRRSQQTWGHGAGQQYLDRSTSDPERFNTSKGIDPWTPYQFSLLNDVQLNYVSAATNLKLAVTGTYFWFLDGANLRYTTDPTVHTMTSTAGAVGTAYDLASDGYNVWAATTSGVWTGNDGTPTPSQYITTSLAATATIGYVLGRLILTNNNLLYNVVSNALPAVLFTHPNPNFVWVGHAAGTGFIYSAGNAGSQGLVYKTAVQPDGTALNIPSIACQLPKGETISAIHGYLGLVLIGSNRGVRVATSDASGNLTLGALITTTSPVQAFEEQSRFAWYGLTDYDSGSTGIGRLDLSTLGALPNAPGTPAFASDLMYTAQGAVTSIASWGSQRLFAVSGGGIVCENLGAVVATGSITTGGITYDVSDLKYAVFVDILPAPNAGTIGAALSIDGGPFVSCGAATVSFTNPGLTSRIELATPQTPCNLLEVRYTLSGSQPQPNAVGVHRTTLRSMIATRSATQFKVPLRLSPQELVGDLPVWFDPDNEREFLEELRVNRTITTFQENNSLYPVTIDVLDWTPDRITIPEAPRNAGVLVVTMTSVT